MRKFINALPVVGFLVIVIVVSSLAQRLGSSKRDDSDPPGGYSGLIIYTDALTGCQYLSLPMRGLTPRMDRNGHQVCAGVI